MDGAFERILRHIVEQPLVFFFGVLVTVGLGILVDWWLNRITDDLRRQPPEGITAENWAALLAWPETYGQKVHWLGLMERCFFYTVLRMATWPFIVAWLLFKLGCYWGIWHNLIRCGSAEAGADSIRSMVTRSRRGNALAIICLFGTLGNLLAALLGAFCATWASLLFHIR